MKRTIAILTLLLMMVVFANAALSEDGMCVEDYYSGVWLNGSSYIEILKDDGKFFVSVNKWRDEESSTKWEYICVLEKDGSLASVSGSRIDYVYHDGTIIYGNQPYDDGSASFFLKNDSLYWDDEKENEGEGLAFQWAPSIPDEYLPPTDAYIDDVFDFLDMFTREEIELGDYRELEGTDCMIWIPRGRFTEADPSRFSDETMFVFSYDEDPRFLLTIERGETIQDYNQFARHLYRKELAGYIEISSLLSANNFPAALYFYDDKDGVSIAVMEYFVDEHEYIKFTMYGYEDLDYTCYGFQIMYSLQRADRSVLRKE